MLLGPSAFSRLLISPIYLLLAIVRIVSSFYFYIYDPFSCLLLQALLSISYARAHCLIAADSELEIVLMAAVYPSQTCCYGL